MTSPNPDKNTRVSEYICWDLFICIPDKLRFNPVLGFLPVATDTVGFPDDPEEASFNPVLGFLPVATLWVVL